MKETDTLSHHILAVITARGGSKGIPGKNIKLLGGKPLIAYTIEQAKKSALITHVIVSTDDEEIANVARKWGGEVPFLRPEELAKDDTPHLPVMRHAISFMEGRYQRPYDFVGIFQPTSPFRTKDDIDQTFKKLIDSGADSAVTLCEVIENHPLKIKRLEGDRVRAFVDVLDETQGLRRQDLPVAYKRSGALYAMRRDTLMVKNMLYGDTVAGHIVPTERSIDIDTPLDWLKAEYMLRELKAKRFGF